MAALTEPLASCAAAPAPGVRTAAHPLGYVPAIDGLRAIAVLTVLLFHLDRTYLPGGFAGVDVFFVISGFVVTAAMDGVKSTGTPGLLATFYARRIVRIVPALAVCLAGTFLLAVLLTPPRGLGEFGFPTGLGAFAGISNIIMMTSGRDYFGPGMAHNPFAQTWSLGVEEQFYLLFPLILLLIRRTRRGGIPMAALLVVGAATLASFLLYASLVDTKPQTAFYLMPARFWELGTGVLLYLTMPVWLHRLQKAPPVLAAAVWGLGLLLLGWFLVRFPGTHFGIPALTLPVGGTALLIALGCARREDWPARLLSARGPVYIGLASYSLYLWHWPLLVLARWTVGLDTAGKQLATLALIFLFTLVSYHLVEKPTRRAAREGRIPRGWILLAGPAVLLAGAAAAAMLVKAQPRLTLTIPAPSPDPYLAKCVPSGEGKTLPNGSFMHWRPCRISASRLFVLGDSHADTYDPLWRRYAAEAGGEVVRYANYGCAFPPLSPPAEELRRCTAATQAALASIARQAKQGDIIIAVGWRMQKDVQPSLSPEERARSADAAVRLMQPLAATHARIIIEAPKPVLPGPTHRCLAWFNRGNPVCREGFEASRPALLVRREPELDILRRIAAALPRGEMWDAFHDLCPSDPCSGVRAGKLLYMDRNHLAPDASLVVWPGLKAVLEGTPDRAGTSHRP